MFTTSPVRVIKPIIVSRSIGWNVTRLVSLSEMMPPTIASGSASMTSRLSRNDLNNALISKYRIAIASARLLAMLAIAVSLSSAVP